jgi:hypothetical protein
MRKKLLGIGAIAFSIFLLVLAQPSLSQTTESATVIVDFNQPMTPVTSQSGFLYGINATRPPDSIIKPLQPKLWRTSQLDLYPRIIASGAQFQLILSDTWGYGAPRGWPYENYTKWEDHVRQLARQNKDKSILWDVWNEPDLNNPFWGGTREQFFETYKRAYQVLRQELGSSAVIGGPSFAKFSASDLKAFLDYCLAQGLEVNFLSWHELNDYDIAAISDRITYARQNFLNNPLYRPLKIQKLYTNETVGPLAQYQPGDVIGYLSEVELSNGSTKACWEPLQGGLNNCFNNALDGLVSPTNSSRFAVWWAYKYYADGVGQRIKSQSNNVRVPALASKNGQVLVGYMTSGVSPLKARITLDLRNVNAIAPGKPLTITILKIPNSGETTTEFLPVVLSIPIPVSVNSFTWTIQGVNLHEGYLVSVN